jgi:hypothetical protein
LVLDNMKKSTIQHLRFPFSFFLMPVFLFALALSGVELVDFRTISVFVILHLLVYPASNGYNSYFDKDEGSIGGVKNPLKVSKELYSVSLLLDVVAIIWASFISLPFAFMVLVYGLVSKAYSHPAIRLKSYPTLGWLTIGIFQGFFTVWMSLVGLVVSWLSFFDQPIYVFAAALSSFLLLGSYPMTQVYQHEEDSKRGDTTISLQLGVLGTFHFTAFLFLLSSIGYGLYFQYFFEVQVAVVFFLILFPVLIFFGRWYFQVRRDVLQADFSRTMRLNFISSLCLNLFFTYLIVIS